MIRVGVGLAATAKATPRSPHRRWCEGQHARHGEAELYGEEERGCGQQVEVELCVIRGLELDARRENERARYARTQPAEDGRQQE